jgi:histidinol dehydrogenase
VSAALRVLAASSRAGRQAVDRLARRGASVLGAKVMSQAGAIVAAVRRGGDAALLAAVERYDGFAAGSVADLALEPQAAAEELPAGFVEAFERALAAVERFHAGASPAGYRLDEDGAGLEEVVSPLGRVGIYVPGGRASYPSTVLMTAVPARLAGVTEIAVATPPATYEASAPLRYALARLELREVWGMGGAQAIAAFAYGTETIRRVDKIVGPGNAWVAAAKKQVFGDVAIDGLAGPSEVLIIADGADEADPALLAADLLAQAEHDPEAVAVLLTPDPRLAREVASEIDRQLPELSTAPTARAALARRGAALVVTDLEAALALAQRIAPEHLQLLGPGAEALAERITAAGAVFVGAATGVVFGDYVAGPSHVLPTCGTARFASALGVEDFLRRSHRVRFTPAAAARRAAAAATLAEAEGLPAHAEAARRRLGV